MNVLIIEAGGSHIECVYTMIHYLHLKNCSVFLACNKKLVPAVIEPEKLSGLLELPDDPSNKQHVSIALKLRKFIKQHNIESVVFNTTEITIVRNLLFLLPRLNYTGIVHNAKRLEKSFTFTKLLAGKMKKYFVLGDYLLSNLHPYPLFRVSSFYPIYFPKVKTLYPVKPPDELWITIPGEVFPERREYIELIKEVEQSTALAENIKFILLGNNHLDEYHKDVLKNTLPGKQHFITFDHYLSYDLFHSYILQSDYILPLLKTDSNGFYGYSRISGSFNLGLGYKIPFLIPASYKENKDILPYSIYYTNMKDLINKIKDVQLDYQQQNQIKEAYRLGKLNDVDMLASEVYDFIVS